MKLRTHEDMLDSVIGVKGTPRRDKLENDIEAYLIGKAIKETRQKQQLTQKQLGELVGDKKLKFPR